MSSARTYAERRPTLATVLLGGVLALFAVALVATGPRDPLLPGRALPAWLLVAGLTACFAVADFALLHVEVRRQAYSLTLAGAPLVLGLLLLDTRGLVFARMTGSAIVFVVQRVPALKVGYNLAAYGFEAALDVVLLHALVGPATDGLTVGVALVGYGVVVAVDQLVALLVVQVIVWHQGRPSARQALDVHLPALLCSLLATTGAYGLLLLATQGALGLLVLSMFLVSSGLVYRGVQVLHRRHQALEHVHEFVGLTTGADTVEELAGRMLGQVRALMRAGTAELLLVEAGSTLRLSSSEDGGLQVVKDEPDRLLEGVRTSGEPVLLARGARDEAGRAWLGTRGAEDAVAVPLPRSSGDGVLLILDRLGDTGSFTREDQALLQTLASHLSVAVRGSTLLDRLRHDATHDALTGLANRALLHEAMTRRLGGPDRAASAVLLLDLDRFKEVNDTLGHAVGDALLCAVATRIRAVLPGGATVARLGGDEFAALVPLAAVPAEDQACWLAHRLAEALDSPVVLPEATLTARASIGVALPGPATTGSDLLRHADTAMYAAKESKDSVRLYTSELDRGRAERLALLADLHLALERDELRVLYQPKLDLASGRITSTEALVRWQHPRLGLLGPQQFVPLAEANALIGPLTQLVLQEALRQCAAWRAQGVDLAVAVNLSARSVHEPALPALVSAALLRAGVPASRLILEITEGSVMEDPDGAVATLQQIAAIGVTLSLDDFGTGYSSLAYLQRLPVREVKIDRSFVSELRSDGGASQLLVRSIVNLSTSLGHRVVAEGAEDAETVELLRGLGCHLVQGYHVARPGTAAQAVDCYRAHESTPPRLRMVSG